MNIVISYHNFLRDYRGSLLLKETLRALGHRVWLTPHWNDDIGLARLKKADVIVGCQIAERSTSYLGYEAQRYGTHLVLNSSEQFTRPENLRAFVTFDCNQLNDQVISIQNIACKDLMSFIESSTEIKNKDVYKYIGFPRYDLSTVPELRSAETPGLKQRYALQNSNRIILYLSSFLFEETFIGVPEEDMERFGYQELIERNKAMFTEVSEMLKTFLRTSARPNDIFLIKKHPWDDSQKIEDAFNDDRVRVLAQNEYIVPCMDAADLILHSFSTAAIEAWVMGKPTAAIVPSGFESGVNLTHMEYENVVKSREELENLLEKSPQPHSASMVDTFLGGLADGNATIRLAREIHKLVPRNTTWSPFTRRQKLKKTLEQFLLEYGFRNPQAIHPSGKMKMLADWERDRKAIQRCYRRPLRRYIHDRIQDLMK